MAPPSMTTDRVTRLETQYGYISQTMEKVANAVTQLVSKTDFDEFRNDMKTLINSTATASNGRIEKLEDRVKDLERQQWRWAGALAVLSVGVGIAVDIVMRLVFKG